jgi:hypothetical protein
MRWTGMRISDAHKFNDSEIVRDETGAGWNADFGQKKTKRRRVSPLPEHVFGMVRALPGQMKAGKRYFFTFTYTAASLLSSCCPGRRSNLNGRPILSSAAPALKQLSYHRGARTYSEFGEDST